MAQAGYTPIQLYYSTTTTNAPTAGNLASGELAINITDGKLFYKDNGGSVQVIAWKTTPTTAGGTGLTSWTAGDLPYYATGTTLSKLGIGTNGQILTSTGTAPQWSTLSGVAVTTFSAGTTGFTPSTATSGAITLAGTLATTNGGTGLTSFTANRVFYASSTSAIAQSANLTFDGTTLTANALTTTSTVTINGGTANGVAYLNGSKVLTTGSALTFDGTRFTVKGGNADALRIDNGGQQYTELDFANNGVIKASAYWDNTAADWYFSSTGTLTQRVSGSNFLAWQVGSEQMRLTSTGLGIGTSSPSTKLHVVGAAVENPGGGSGSRAVVKISDTTSVAANNGGGIVFQGIYTGTTQVDAAGIQAYKENSTDGNYAYGLSFVTRANGGNLTANMKLDSSGNLGLGVTPSAWSGTNGGAFQFGSGYSSLYSYSNAVTLGSNVYYNLGNKYYASGVGASAYQQLGGVHYWLTAPSGTAGNTISFTQAMTLDASGNLLVGYTTAYDKLQVNGSISSQGGGYFGFYRNGPSNNIATLDGVTISQFGISSGVSTGRSDASTWIAGFDSLRLVTAGIERARITSVGNFSLGGTVDRGTTVGTNAIQIFNGTAPAGTLTNGVSLYSQSGDLRFMDAAGNAYQVGFRNVPQSGAAKTGSYTLATTDVGEFILINSGGSIVVPTSTFSAGDVVSLFNNTTGNITITCSAPTAYIAGANTVVTSVTLATRGVATVLFITATLCVITGNVS